MTTTARERWMAEGAKRARRETLVRQLGRRFGEVPAAVLARIDAASADELVEWLDHVTGAIMLDYVFERPLETEMETFEAHRAELVARAVGKYVLIKEDKILGIIETRDEAIEHGWTTLGYVPICVKLIAEVDRVETL